MNEFYAVVFYGGDVFYFKNKDNAFAYLRQEYLNTRTGKESRDLIQKDLEELNEFYMITNFGEVCVIGFED